LKIKENAKNLGLGVIIGAVNGLFGAGGGMIAVPILKRGGLSQNEAHENAVAVILPITVISAVIYCLKGYVKMTDALPFIPLGLVGSFIGSKIIRKISPKILKGIFSAFMIYAGIRLIVK